MKNTYRIEGDTVFVQVKKRNGDVLEFLVDADELPMVQACPAWFQRSQYICNSKGEFLHRLLGKAPGHLVCDHINLNTLDNRNANLRPATRSMNALNKNCSNVYYLPETNNYLVRFMVGGKVKRFGRYRTQAEAIAVANAIRPRLINGEAVTVPKGYRLASSGVRGVYWSKGKWQAQFHFDGYRKKTLGHFSTKEEAVEALESF